MTYFDNAEFQDLLAALLLKDKRFLIATGHLLSADDFRPRNGHEYGRERWILVQLALDYYQKYKHPLGRMLSTEVLDYCRSTRSKDSFRKTLLDFGRGLFKKKILAADSLLDKVVQFKREKSKAAAIEEVIDLQAKGQLTDEKWLDICRGAVDVFAKDPYRSADYFVELEDRIVRREQGKGRRFPLFLIDPLDIMIRNIGPGHLGLMIAPYKRGKSLMLLWLTLAYTLQRLRVLFITLEDPQDDVEDRFDAAVTCLPYSKLTTMTRTLRYRFMLYKRLVKGRLKIIDGTETGFSVPMIEAAWEKERSLGFSADVVVVDYDDEIRPSRKQADRRQEFADVYRELRQFSARKQVILWTAAQTQRGTESFKILSGDRLAEDISKIRKVSLAISLGQGDWGDESLYLWVAASKFTRQHVGVNIMSDRERMLIYDRDATIKAMKEEKKGAYGNVDE